MKLGLRLLLGFFLITGIAAFFVLRVFMHEIRPSVREVMEDVLIDTANILAEMAADELAAMPEGANLQSSNFAQRVQAYSARPMAAKIWGLTKQSLDYRVYITDRQGRVVFDSGTPDKKSALGEDYSRWRDVHLTLAGRYGARSTREVATDENSSVMVVAAPVKRGERVIGVLAVAKPLRTVQPFIERAEHKIFVSGLWLLGLSLLVGVVVTGWLIWSVRRLRRYAQEVQVGERRQPPQLSGELGELAASMGAMRERLDGREHLEQTVRAFTHELKSPMAAISAAAELLQDEIPEADRLAFSRDIRDQVARQRDLVDRMLELSKLEHRRSLDHVEPLDLTNLVADVALRFDLRARQQGVEIKWLQADQPLVIRGDAEILELAVSNLLENAVDFSPPGSCIDVCTLKKAGDALVIVRDHGPGVKEFALARLGERFFSTERPKQPGEPIRKGTGLGLAIVREVMALHRGQMQFENCSPGLKVTLALPLP